MSSIQEMSNIPMQIQVTRNTYSNEEDLGPPEYAVGRYYRPLVSPFLYRPSTQTGEAHGTGYQLADELPNGQLRPELSKRGRAQVFLNLRRKFKLASSRKRSRPSSAPVRQPIGADSAGACLNYVGADQVALSDLPPVLVCNNIVYMPVDNTVGEMDMFSGQSSPIATGPAAYRVQDLVADEDLPPYKSGEGCSQTFVEELRRWMTKVRQGRVFRKADGSIEWLEIAGLLGAVAVAGVMIVASVVFVLVIL